MRACICDVCGKVEAVPSWGVPVGWIVIEQRGEEPPEEDDPAEAFAKAVVFEASVCSWVCVAKLAAKDGQL